MADAKYTAELKSCTSCAESKPLDMFGIGRNKCKKCQAAYDKERNDKKANKAFRAAKEERDRLLLSGRCRCVECKEISDLSHFPNAKNKGYRCRPCMSAQRRAWSKENREKDRENWRRSNKNNPETKRQYNARYLNANRERLYAARRQWYWDNKEYFNTRNYAKQVERLATDPVYALSKRIRRLILLKMQNAGYTKRSSTQEILGCDWQFFKRHIERQFSKGMSWDNRGDWHLDHIVPIATADSEEDVIRLNHFTNLRPMWAKDNRSKSSAITHLI